MTLLDRVMPEPRLVELDGVDVAVSAARAWEVVRHGDLARSPLVRALFAVRTLPSRITGSDPEPSALSIDDIGGHDRPGFRILGEDAGTEVVLGAIGKVWHLDIPFVRVEDAAQFASFREPDYAKVAWALRVLPRGDDGARVEVEVRVDATDEASWRRFRRYFRLIGPGSHFIRRTLLATYARELGTPAAHERPRDDWRDVDAGVGGAAAMAFNLLTPFLRGARTHHGVDAATAARVFPGDERIPAPRWSWTHGIEIDAPPKAVWPWVAQMGADRGGFYSHQWLENLVGCGMKNAEVVHPEWALRVGDTLVLHPKMPGLPIVEVEPERYLLGHGAPDPTAVASGKAWVAATWLFHLEPLEGGRTRLISRFRSDSSDDLATRLKNGPYLTESIGFVMDRQMLKGIEQRVRRRAREALTTDAPPTS